MIQKKNNKFKRGNEAERVGRAEQWMQRGGEDRFGAEDRKSELQYCVLGVYF